MFRVIVVTEPAFRVGEAAAIARLLDSGAVWRVHLRKPGCTEARMRRLIEALPERLHCRLSLHDCHELAADYGAGVHQNSRCASGIAAPVVSRSCHSLEEVDTCRATVDYCFLSPVYDSISKQGYLSEFTLCNLAGRVDSRVMALGGVRPERFGELRRAGFGGAAMLGCVWQAVEQGRTGQLIQKIQCCNS